MPVTVWLVAVGTVVWLFYQRMQQFEIVGIARGEVRQVAATCTGRIMEIPDVALFPPVKAGQTLVVLDTVADNELVDEAELKAELAAAGGRGRVSLAAQLIPTQEQLRVETASLQINRQDNWRRFEVDVDSARLRILELQAHARLRSCHAR